MDDLISRQVAIDAILENEKVYSHNFGDDPIDKYTVAIIDNDAQTIANLPSADAVEVVRCKDCVHWRRPDGPCPFGLLRFNTSPPNGFCHLRERKEDD